MCCLLRRATGKRYEDLGGPLAVPPTDSAADANEQLQSSLQFLLADETLLTPPSFAGGGVVEGYPHDLWGEKFRRQFLFGSTHRLFKEVGFSSERPKGK